jgi:predicted thioesterase
MDRIKPGLVGTATMTVGTNDTAPRVGSGKIAVLATPVMINLMEEAALDAVEHLLPEGKQSLGTHLDVTHSAATPTGMKVTARAELVRVDGRNLFFNLVAHDEVEEIGSGQHQRVVVTAASFAARIEKKMG